MTKAPIDGRNKFPTRILKQWDILLRSKDRHTDYVSDRVKIKTFNDSVNLRFKYIEDETDDWKSPIRFVNHKGGDCEDFAIYKYFRLPYPRYLAVGVLPEGKVHAVLTLYAQEFGDWVFLDNRTDDIVPWDKYTEIFKPIYLCDDKAVYI